MNYTHTVRSCFMGYIVQAAVNTYIPLLFVTFQREYGLSLVQVTSLVSINFAIQLLTDLIAAKYIDRMGYRSGLVLAHILAALGFLSLAIVPSVLSNAYAGILFSVVLYAVGGGLLEVLVSPVVEACPTDYKEKTMSMLHSFYCWGHVGVVLLSTLFFTIAGIEHWRILTAAWAVLPLINVYAFLKVPIASLLEDGEASMGIRLLLKNKLFWVLFLLMVAAGASEQAVSQWASAYAERGLGVSKAVGDLAGPMLFASMMGLSRLLYGKYGEKISLIKFILGSGMLAIVSYVITAAAGIPAVNLIGCGLCGFSVGIMWPGVFSLAAAGLRTGGTAMFALLALAGDVGCSLGPALVGLTAERMQGEISMGILASIIFPIIFVTALLWYIKICRKTKEEKRAKAA